MRYRTCIIVVTFNSINYLERICASLAANVDASKDVIAFIDNGSSDGTADYLDDFSKKVNGFVLRNLENKGFGQANNRAMRAVEADYYLLLNPDTYLLNNIIDDIFSHYPDPSDIDIVGPYLIYPDGSYQTSAYAFASPVKWILQDLQLKRLAFWLSEIGIGRRILRLLTFLPMAKPFVTGMLSQGQSQPGKRRELVDFVTGACMLISRKVFEATGGFDENIFLYGEDEELCFRAKKMGFKAERVAAGPVVHYLGWNKNKARSDAVSFHAYESLAYVIEKNYQSRILKKWLLLTILRKRLRRLQKASKTAEVR